MDGAKPCTDEQTLARARNGAKEEKNFMVVEAAVTRDRRRAAALFVVMSDVRQSQCQTKTFFN
jgi:hypothetical protein